MADRRRLRAARRAASAVCLAPLGCWLLILCARFHPSLVTATLKGRWNTGSLGSPTRARKPVPRRYLAPLKGFPPKAGSVTMTQIWPFY